MRRRLLLSSLIPLLLFGCASAKSPSVRSERAEMLDHEKAGMIVRVHASANNPNATAVSLTSARGKLFVEGIDTGDATVRASETLAPNGETPLQVDVQVPWNRVAYAVGKARPETRVQYRFAGTLVFDLGKRQVEVPIEQVGEVEKTKILLAALRHIGLPKDLLNR